MRNRWFHVPAWHTPEVAKKVSWLELFYDLIFVAAFIQLGNGLIRGGGVTPGRFLAFCAVFVPLWISWTGFTYFVNRYTVDDIAHRLLVFAKMMTVGVMAVTAPEVLDGKPARFALAYAGAQALVALMYLRAYRLQEQGRAYARYWGTVFALGCIIWAASALVPSPYCFVLWTLGAGAIMGAPFNRRSRELQQRYPQDHEHLSERYGLLTIIVLGESFVKVVGNLTDKGSDLGAMAQACLALAITCCLWWIYFDDIAGSRVKDERLYPVIWLFAHLPLQIAVTAAGVAIKMAVSFNLHEVVPASGRWMLSGTLALALLSTALIDSVTERRQAELSDRARVNVRLFSGLFILVIAGAGHTLTGAWFLAAVTLVCLGQVIFDMVMAPLEAREHEGEHAVGIHELFRVVRPPRGVHRDISEAVRKGTPSNLRKDFYFYLMEGSWRRLFLTVLVLFLVVNAFFAGLYLLAPDAIHAVRPDSFADAFFFSVQTMSTIGYGTMSPATTYGHLVVTLEAVVGLLGVAMVTGLMFAKVSKPRAAVLFSHKIVITRRHGVPTLMFRVGNTRGSELVDATLNFSVLMEERSPEGHHMRRFHPLALVRGHTPFFALTWSIMHVIDENSPLFHEKNNCADFLSLLATLVGHDGTYGQTVHARHAWYPEDMLCGHRFVDIISELPDGRMMVDYDHFHDTVPDVNPSPAQTGPVATG